MNSSKLPPLARSININCLIVTNIIDIINAMGIYQKLSTDDALTKHVCNPQYLDDVIFPINELLLAF
ncbi:12870_t:CDS:2 [Cetraspora pellucida]|uniref:12870_t:CDS:1 n=1 Tax=Cetraspora pellucida TaxID=1433469 RepID=A0A9N9B6P5_9GLOM|nr:12870_t:CDS:2 [Cetraspora pellucida]